MQIKYGPLSPQELDKAVAWLEAHHIEFDIEKDEKIEKEFQSNFGDNVLKRSEFRTETYLAQVFFIEIKEISEALKLEFDKLLKMQNEVLPDSLKKQPGSVHILYPVQTKRYVAWLLTLLWIILIIKYALTYVH